MRMEISSLFAIGLRPLRTIPLTTELGSNSGCSSVGLALRSALIRRGQSVLDFAEVTLRFTGGRFAEGDDTDFIVGFGVGYGYGHPCKKAQRDEAPLLVAKALILKS